MKFRITRIGLYLYHHRWTLSFTWRCRWIWLPERLHVGCVEGWSIWWGWFSLELMRWAEGDDWGEKACESMAETLAALVGATK